MKSTKRIMIAMMVGVALSIVLINPDLAFSKPAPGKTPIDYIKANIAAEMSKDESTKVVISIKNAQGKSQERTLEWKTITLPSGDKRSIVRFVLPKAIKGTGLLIHENKGKDDERWLYLPSLKKTRRISGTDKADTFMGTDFSYEDLVTEEIEHHSYSYDPSQDCAGKCVVVVAVPKTDKERAESGYSKRRITIDTEINMVTAVDFYNKSGAHSKRYRASEFRRVSPSGSIRPHRMEMADVINRNSSVMVFDSYAIDAGVDPDQITLRALTQGQ